MYGIRTDTEGGIKTFIEDQKKLPGEALVTLAQFDNRYDVVYESAKLDDIDYQLIPRGSTSLCDAIGKFVTDLGETLRNQSEDERPGKVVVLILTDGMENSSKEWDTDSVKKLVTQQQEHWSWEFVFMGANVDAISEAKHFGIRGDNAINYAPSSAGVTNVFSSASGYVTNTRSGLSNVGFTDEDRSAAMEN